MIFLCRWAWWYERWYAAGFVIRNLLDGRVESVCGAACAASKRRIERKQWKKDRGECILVACVKLYMWTERGNGNDLSARDCESNPPPKRSSWKRVSMKVPPDSHHPRFLSPSSEHLCAVSRSNILPLKARKARTNAVGSSARMKRSETRESLTKLLVDGISRQTWLRKLFGGEFGNAADSRMKAWRKSFFTEYVGRVVARSKDRSDDVLSNCTGTIFSDCCQTEDVMRTWKILSITGNSFGIFKSWSEERNCKRKKRKKKKQCD